jgi:hypothetical protein
MKSTNSEFTAYFLNSECNSLIKYLTSYERIVSLFTTKTYMKSSLFVFLACISSIELIAQNHLINKGNLIQQNGTSLILKNCSIENNGYFTMDSTANISILGDSLSVFSGDSTFHISNIKILHSGENAIRLENSLNIKNTIQFQNGNIDLNGQVINLATNALLINESEQSRVKGESGHIEITQSLGSPQSLNLGNLGLYVTAPDSLGLTTIKRFHAQHQNLPGNLKSITRQFEIIPTYNNLAQASIQASYLHAELNENNEAHLNVYKQIGNSWELQYYSVRDSASNTIEKDGITSFSRYALGAIQDSLVAYYDSIRPRATISGNATICNGISNGQIEFHFTGASPFTLTYSDGNNNITVQNIQSSPYTISPSATGTYQIISAYAHEIKCSTSGQVVVNAGSTPILNALTKTDIICGQSTYGSIQVSSNATSYILYPTNSQNSNGNFSPLTQGNYTISMRDNAGCSLDTTFHIDFQGLSFNSVLVDEASYCNNGDGKISATVNVLGSTTYSLNITTQNTTGIFSSLNSGTYTLTASNSGCDVTSIVQVNTTSILSANEQITNPYCKSEGSIALAPTGGNSSYFYSIAPIKTQSSPGVFSNLNAGSYTIAVNDGQGCSITKLLTLTNSSNVSYNPHVLISPSCNGSSDGSIFLNANGGLAPYSYTITPNKTQPLPGAFINLSSSIYLVIASDAAGCTKSTVIIMAQPRQITFNSITKTNISCYGEHTGSISTLANGGSGVKTYYGMNATTSFIQPLTNLSAGSYTIFATDANSCTKTTLVNLTQPSEILFSTPVIIHPSNNTSGSIVVSATGGVGSKSYQQLPSGNSNNTGVFSNLSAGAYTIAATDASLCSKTISIILTQNLLAQKIDGPKWQVYPIPSKGNIQIDYLVQKSNTVILQLLDLKGNLIMNESLQMTEGVNHLELNIFSQAKGIYILQLLEEDQKHIQKIILE